MMAERKTWRRRAVRLMVLLALIYLGVVAIFYSYQAKLIFPGTATQGDPAAEVVPRAGEELLTLETPGGERVVALFGTALGEDGTPRPDAATCPTLLYFYGNGMCLQSARPQLELFRRLGLNVMVPDYLGYGMSGGQASELGCRATAEAAFQALALRPDVDRGRIVVAGWSLGGGVAIDLASRHPVAGVAVFSTFTSLVDMVHRLYPFLPAALLLNHRFDSLAKVKHLDCPLLIGHGAADQLIPIAMADQLAAAAPGPVTRVAIPEADHNDFFDVGGDRITQPLRQFVEHLPRRP